jgi:hypothetical protein
MVQSAAGEKRGKIFTSPEQVEEKILFVYRKICAPVAP